MRTTGWLRLPLVLLAVSSCYAFIKVNETEAELPAPVGGQTLAWPTTAVLGSEKALFVFGHVFFEGDSVTFDYDSTLTVLVINGIPLQRPGAPPEKEPRSPKAQWTHDLMSALSDTVGTLEQRLTHALAILGTQYLDEDFHVHAGSCSVQLKFKGDPDPITLITSPPPVLTLQLTPEDVAKTEASRQLRYLQSDGPYFGFEFEDAVGGLHGAGALEAIGLARSATQRHLTEQEQERAAHLYMQPMHIKQIRELSKRQRK
jgi:hypothetical protein